MRLILQRVSRGAVVIDGAEQRSTGPGLVVLVGICPDDTRQICQKMADKMAGLRIFADEAGNLNLSLQDVQGDCMVISNFTLYANCRKGRRPSFTDAAPPQQAQALYEAFVDAVKGLVKGKVVTGEFGAHMEVELVNDGPVTILLDSDAVLSAPRNP